jgi:TonB family protein
MMIIYFLQVSLAWSAFLLLYHIGLRRERFLVANRVYLLSTFCLSLLIPLWQWSGPGALTPEAGSEVAYWLQQVVISSERVDHSPITTAVPWFWYIYLAGCGLTLTRLLYGLWQIQKLSKQAVFRQEAGIWIGELKGISQPFSWGPYLFLNRENFKDWTEYRAVLAHERAHIKQVHSMDIMLLQVVGIFFWWNPLWYFYRQSIRNLHEFLADAAAIQELPTRQYGQLLLLQHVGYGNHPHLSHTFYTSPLKSRIMMLTKKKVGRYAAWKYLALLPILALVLFACNAVDNPDTTEMKKEMEDYAFVEQVDTIITFNPDDYTETMEVIKSKSYKEAEMMPLFGNCPDLSGDELRACSDRNMLEYIYSNIKYPKTASAAGLEGMIIAKLIIDTEGKVASVEIVKSDLKGDKDLDTASEEEASQLQIGMKAMENEVLKVARSMPEWQPGTIQDEPVRVQVMLPIRFKLE